jgi:hypothetical protein
MVDDGQSGSSRSHAEAKQLTWWGQLLAIAGSSLRTAEIASTCLLPT